MTSLRAACVVVWLGALACGSVSTSPDGGGGSGGGTTGGAGGGAGRGGETGTAGATSAAGTTGGGGVIGGAGQTVLAGSSGTAGVGGGNAPGPFTQSLPANGNISTDALTMFSWNASGGALSYIVEVSTSPTFDPATPTTLLTATDTTATATAAFKPGLVYSWRVKAQNAHGTTIASNAASWFTVPVSVGAKPYGLAVTSTGKAVVVNNVAPGSLTLVDLSTFATEAIALPGQPVQVAVTPDGKTALATQGSPNAIAVVDLVAKAATGGVNPPCVATTYYGLAIKADGSAAVVPDFNGGCTKDVLDVIPLPGTAIAKAIDLASSASAFGVAVTPDGATAIVTRGALTTSVKRVDLAGGGVTVIANTSSSFGVAITSDGKTAYVTSGPGETVKPIDLATGAVGTGIAFDSNQEVCNVAVTPDGKHAVVAGDFKTGVLDLVAGTVTSTYGVGGKCVAVSADGARAFLTGATGKLHVIKMP